MTTVHIFTDGSKTKGRTGFSMIAFGSHDTIRSTYQRLPNHTSAFDAETSGLIEALKLANDLSISYPCIKIFSDSKSSLLAFLKCGMELLEALSEELNGGRGHKGFTFMVALLVATSSCFYKWWTSSRRRSVSDRCTKRPRYSLSSGRLGIP